MMRCEGLYTKCLCVDVSDWQNVLCLSVNMNVRIGGRALFLTVLGRNGIEFIDLPHNIFK